MTGFDHVRTGRLRLDRVTLDDVDELHELYELHADPAVWAHFPQARHDARDKTAALVEQAVRDWEADGLSYWSVREASEAAVVGIAGCARRREGRVWNLYYRLRPSVWGRGYAGEVAAKSDDAARTADPGTPVIAFLLEHNEASRRTAERAGLELVWKGPDAGNPDPDAIRLIYADRVLESETLAALTRE